MTAICLTAVLAFIGSAAAMPSSPDLATKAGVERYLKSLGVDPAGVVVQRGVRNYAGPHCPGRGWRCTNATRVLQLGIENIFVCEPGQGSNEPGRQTCVIVQPNPARDNFALCIQHTDDVPAVQSCSIRQTGRRNLATVIQSATQGSRSVQSALQTADVTQTGSVLNGASVAQSAVQATSEGADQAQDAHQVGNVVQQATRSAPNALVMRQSQFQRAFDGSSQRQNAGVFPSEITDCGLEPFGPTQPNGCAKVTQTSVAGTNNVWLNQSLDQKAQTTAQAVQQQGTGAGGLEGDIHQVTSTGSSQESAEQEKAQELLAAPGSAQTQFDPISCCGIGSQVGGAGNRENIDQDVTQRASEGTAARQLSELFGTTNTPGACSITHEASNEADSTSAEVTRPDACGIVILATVCTTDVGEPSIAQEPGCFSREVPPPDGGEG